MFLSPPIESSADRFAAAVATAIFNASFIESFLYTAYSIPAQKESPAPTVPAMYPSGKFNDGCPV